MSICVQGEEQIKDPVRGKGRAQRKAARSRGLDLPFIDAVPNVPRVVDVVNLDHISAKAAARIAPLVITLDRPEKCRQCGRFVSDPEKWAGCCGSICVAGLTAEVLQERN